MLEFYPTKSEMKEWFDIFGYMFSHRGFLKFTLWKGKLESDPFCSLVSVRAPVKNTNRKTTVAPVTIRQLPAGCLSPELLPID